MSDPVAIAIAGAASRTSAAAIEAAAAAVEGAAGWSPGAQHRLLSADPAPGYLLHVRPVAEAWQAQPSLAGAGLAAALRAAEFAVAEHRRDNKVSLVWTGPPTEEIGLRSTRAVLNTLVARASESILLVSYAGYDVDDLVSGLRSAVDRGAEVTMILETKADGGLTVDAANAFKDLRGLASFYKWPLEKRAAQFAGSARLHAKCAIRDRTEALITSANLTGAAINDNMELGVLIESGAIPARLYRHFQLLIADEVLEQA